MIVDWQGGADIVNYLQAASNTRTTGAYTAQVVNNLVSNGGAATSRVWCVGHSLGSHVCGHLGMTTFIGRITGKRRRTVGKSEVQPIQSINFTWEPKPSNIQ